jgi:hypothetical protein
VLFHALLVVGDRVGEELELRAVRRRGDLDALNP